MTSLPINGCSDCRIVHSLGQGRPVPVPSAADASAAIRVQPMQFLMPAIESQDGALILVVCGES